MRWWPFSQRIQEQGEDLDAALRQADRAIDDARQQRRRAADVTGRLADTWARNHIAEAVIRSIQGT